MSQGLSHIVLRATTPEDFERTKQFYTAFGFEQILDQEDRTAVSTSERRVWLKLSAASSSLTSELTIKLALSPSAMRQEQLPDEIDWALKEYSVVLNTSDLSVSLDRVSCVNGRGGDGWHDYIVWERAET